MHVLKTMGLIDQFPEPENKEDSELGTILVMASEAFLRAGGIVTLEEWRDLSEIERAAMTAAGDNIRTEMAALIGVASQDSLSAAEVMAPVDGGETKEKLGLAIGVAAAAEKLRGKTVE